MSDPPPSTSTQTGPSGLVYSLSPATAPMSSGDPPNVVTFTLTITAPQGDPVKCSQIDITIPTSLSPSSSAPPTASCQPATWMVRATSANQVVGIPASGSTASITPGSPATITLANVAIASAPGTPSVTVQTVIPGEAPDVVNLPVNVFQPGFTVQSFTLSPAVTEPFQQVTLSWSVEGTATCILYSPTNPDGLSMDGNSYTDQPSVTTTYTVSWTSTSGATATTITQQLTVIVDELAILLIDVWLPNAVAGLTGGAAVMRWQTQQAAYVILDPGRIVLPTALPATGPSFNAPGAPAVATISYDTPSTLTVDATGAGGPAAATIPYTGNSVTLSLTAVHAGGNQVQESIVLPVPSLGAVLTASASTADEGDTVTLNWQVFGATSATLDEGLGKGPQPLDLGTTVQPSYQGSVAVAQPQYGIGAVLVATEGSTSAKATAAVMTNSGIPFYESTAPANGGPSMLSLGADAEAGAAWDTDLSWMQGLTVHLTGSSLSTRTGAVAGYLPPGTVWAIYTATVATLAVSLPFMLNWSGTGLIVPA